MTKKICKECNIEKEATTEYFYERKECKSGLRATCKDCFNKKSKLYKESNKDYYSEYNKKYATENKEELKIKKNKYYKENLNIFKENHREYYVKNKEAITLKVKQYAFENKELIAERSKIYREENKIKLSALSHNYYLRNSNKLKEYQQSYKKTAKGKLVKKKSNQKRKTTKSENGGFFTQSQWQECLDFFKNECAYTGEPLTTSNCGTDHIVAVSKGGNSYIWNICPSVHSANSSKNNKTLDEWYPAQPFYSKERIKRIFEWIGYSKAKYQFISKLPYNKASD